MVEVVERILEMLRAHGEGISGAEMSRGLGISRSAVWKHIEGLRREGYKIDATPGRGYRLVGTPLHITSWEVKVHLGTAFIGREVYVYQETTSTNEVAFRLARNGAKEGTVVMAEAQTRGRGRMGRRWVSPGGVNIYLSCILRPTSEPTKTPLITLLAAVACAEGIEEVVGLLPEIKWPNDLLYKGRKLGGILTEAEVELDRIKFLVVGIGINCNMQRGDMPPEIRDQATSLKEAIGGEVARVPLVKGILRRFEHWYLVFTGGRWHEVRERWKELAAIEGRMVEVYSPTEKIKGRMVDIDEDGALLVMTDEERIKRVVAGDVTLKGR